MEKNMHIGSDFDDFLKEEGIFEEVESAAISRVRADELAMMLIDRGFY